MKTQFKILFIFLSTLTLMLSSCTKSGDSTVSSDFLIPRSPAVEPQIILKEAVFNIQEDTELFSLLTDQMSSNLSVGTDITDSSNYIVTEEPKFGSLSLDKNGQFLYVPLINYVGVDSFKYEVTIKNKVYENSVKIKVLDVNDKPMLFSETFNIEEDSILNTSINSLDVDSLFVTYSLVQSTSHGFITVLPTGQVAYLPSPNFYGVDTFKVKVNDGIDDSDIVTYTINVTPVNDTPVVQNLTFGVNAGDMHIGQLLASDNDLFSTLNYSLVSQGAKGIVVINPLTGAFSYTANIGTFGNDTFTFRVNDGLIYSQTKTVTAVINPVNLAPTIINGLSLTTLENTPLNNTVFSQVSDINNDELSYMVIVPPVFGTIIMSEQTGEFIYTPNPHYHGVDSFSFNVNDGQFDSNLSVVSITVEPVNDSPLTSDLAASVLEDNTLVDQVVGSDIDGDILSYYVVSQPQHGVVVMNLDGTYSYVPNLDFNGTDSFSFMATDNLLSSNVSQVSITVIPVNDQSVVSGDSLSINENQSVSNQVSANDVDGDVLTYSIVTNPTKGTVILNANGSYTYTPFSYVSGLDSFSFRSFDGQIYSLPEIVTISINNLNDTPEANSTTLTVNEDSFGTKVLTGNDLDENTLTYQLVNQPDHGTATINSVTGLLTYTPNANYNGSDSLTFTTHDGTTNSSEATVIISVIPVNDISVTTSDTLAVTEDTSKTYFLSASDIDGDILTYSIVNSPTHGTLNLNPSTGSFTYTPNLDYVGNDSFTFKVNDGLANSNISTISIVVGGDNDSPISTNGSLTLNEDNNGSGNLSATDVDGDSLTYSVVTSPTKGTLNLNASTGSYVYTPNSNENGSDSFTFRANDGSQNSNESSVSITITPINDNPVSSNSSLTATEDTVSTNNNLTATDVDGDTLTYSVVTSPTKGTVSLNAVTGVYSYTPNTNQTGSDSFTFKVNDGTVDSHVATVLINISNTNDTPTTSNGSLTTNEDSNGTGNLLANDLDGDSLTYSIIANPSKGTISLNSSTGAYTYTPVLNQNGSDSFTFRVTDGSSNSNISTVSVTITPVNDLPTTLNGSLTTNEDTLSGGNLNSIDVDGDSLTYSIVTSPTKGTISLNSSTGAYTYTPTANQNGSDSFTFRTNDGTGNSNVSTVSININSSNDVPTTSNGSLTTNEDTVGSGTLSASDIDGDTLTYSIVTSPTKGTISLNSATGEYTYTPALNQNGSDSFTFRVNDGSANSNVSITSITITPVNDAPVSSNGSLTTNEDSANSGTLVSSDVDGDSLTYSIVTAPTKGTISLNSATGAYTYTPTVNLTGSDSFTFRTNDGTINSNTATVSITINPANDLPTTSNSSLTTNEDTSGSGNLISSDIDGDTLTYSMVTTPTKGTVSLNSSTGAYTYTPTANQNGLDSFTFRTNDSSGNSNTSTVSITITPVNDVPVTSNSSLTVNEDSSNGSTLTASDIDGDSLTYSIVTNPTKGTVSLNAFTGSYVYTPSPNLNGMDSFTFRVNDGTVNSNTSTVSITITPVAEEPAWTTSTTINLTTNKNSSINTTLMASDSDGGAITYSVASCSNGTCSINSSTGVLTYNPPNGYSGSATITARCSNGSFFCNPNTTINVTVLNPNQAPVANGQNLTLALRSSTNITLTGSDGNNDTLSYVVVSQPAHGTLSGTGSNLTYTHNSGAWTSCASEGSFCSFTGTKLVKYGTTTNYLVVRATNGIDCSNNTMSDPIVGAGKTCWYASTSDSFTFKVNDGTIDSSVATVNIDLQDWYNTNWSNRRKLVFNAPITSNLTNFPVLVKIDNTRINYAVMQANGQDLRFVDSDGQVLAHEIESWNSSGISYVWVKTTMGSMEKNNHYIYMYYGNLSATDGQDVSNVWSNGYVSVWHLNQTTGTVIDSVGNNNGTVSGTLTRNTAGPFGNSYTNASSSACVTIPHNSSQLLSSKFTVESWAKSTTDSQNSSIIQKDIQDDDDYFWAYSLENSSGRIATTVTDNSLDSSTYTTSNKYWTLNTWTYNVLTYDNYDDTARSYQNGSLMVTNTSATRGLYSGSQGRTLNIIGDCSSAGFRGSVDEIRISNVERSSDWIKSQYLSMNDGLIMYGNEQLWGTPSSILNKISYVMKISQNTDDGNVSVGLSSWNSSGESGSGVNWMGEENNQDSFGYYRFQLPTDVSSLGVSNVRLKIMGADSVNYGAWNSSTHYLKVSVQRSSNASAISSLSYPGNGVTDSTNKINWNASSLNWNGSTWNVSPNLMTSLNEVSSSYMLSADNYIQLWVKRGASFNCGASSWCQAGGLDYSSDNGKNSAQLLIEY